MPALAIRAPEDAMLGAMAPLGLAIAAPGPALVVDLDPRGPSYFGSGSLAELVAEGPRRADLSPSRDGVAVLRNGGIQPREAIDVVLHLIAGWPFVVVRVASPPPEGPWPLLPLKPLLPGGLCSRSPGPALYQDAGWRVAQPGPGIVLPVPRRATWLALANGKRPPRDRWVRTLSKVWAWA